jgi:alcohol dehydrogenase class IV
MSDPELFGLGPGGAAPEGEYGFMPMEKVRFGPGSVAGLAEEVDRVGGTRVLIVTGTTLATKTDLVDRLKAVLGDRCVGVFSDTRQHVPRTTVIAAAQAAREAGADCLVSFGGGSPVDTTKLVALCLAAGITEPAEMSSYHFREVDGGIEIPQLPEIEIPHIAVSTTLSAGEFTLWGGATDVERGVKDAYGAPGLTPKVVILDPELTAQTPASLWGTTGLKALDHAIETVSSSKPQPIGDALALRSIEILVGALARSTADPSDVAARGLCQVGAWMSILSLPSVPAGLSHALGHQLGAHCDVPHGVTSCIVLPAVMDFNRPVIADRQRKIAEAMGIETAGMDDEAAAAAASDRLRELVSELGVKTKLSEWGVTDEDLVAIAGDSVEDFMSLTNPRKVENEEQVLELLRGLH